MLNPSVLQIKILLKTGNVKINIFINIFINFKLILKSINKIHYIKVYNN